MEPSEIHIESIHLNSPERDDDDDHKSSDLEDGNNNSIQGRSFTDTFSSLHIDQLNTQDVNQLLQTQRQMYTYNADILCKLKLRKIINLKPYLFTHLKQN